VGDAYGDRPRRPRAAPRPGAEPDLDRDAAVATAQPIRLPDLEAELAREPRDLAVQPGPIAARGDKEADRQADPDEARGDRDGLGGCTA
jgi:hypothetical protein